MSLWLSQTWQEARQGHLQAANPVWGAVQVWGSETPPILLSIPILLAKNLIHPPPIQSLPVKPELAASQQPFIRHKEITAFNHSSYAWRLWSDSKPFPEVPLGAQGRRGFHDNNSLLSPVSSLSEGKWLLQPNGARGNLTTKPRQGWHIQRQPHHLDGDL
jgi:hypothetical protein